MISRRGLLGVGAVGLLAGCAIPYSPVPVATDLQVDNEVLVVTAHACYTAQRIYAPVGGELTHGGGIETLAVLIERCGEQKDRSRAGARDSV